MTDDWVKHFQHRADRSGESVDVVLFLLCSLLNRCVCVLAGGYMHAVCPHGVVYAYKMLTRHESPRDAADILFSLRLAQISQSLSLSLL
jgi:hypothetical protein